MSPSLVASLRQSCPDSPTMVQRHGRRFEMCRYCSWFNSSVRRLSRRQIAHDFREIIPNFIDISQSDLSGSINVLTNQYYGRICGRAIAQDILHGYILIAIVLQELSTTGSPQRAEVTQSCCTLPNTSPSSCRCLLHKYLV